MKIRAAVLRQPGLPVEVEEVELDPPKPARCSFASRPPASVIPTCATRTVSWGTGHWPMVLGHEGAGVVEEVGDGVTHVTPGDHVSLCFVPACRSCRYCLAGKPNLCLRRRRARVDAGCSWTARAVSGSPTGRRSSTACGRRASPSTPSSRRAAPSRSPASCRSGRPRCSAAASSRAWARCATSRRAPRRVGRRVRLRRCRPAGGRGARLAGASPIVAVDRVPEKLELARAQGATHTIDATAEREPVERHPAAHRRRRRLRVRGDRAARDDQARLGRHSPGWHGRRRRARPRGGRGERAGDRVPRPTSRSRARTTAPATRRPSSRSSPRWPFAASSISPGS